jgi:predicted enzyme related to lactoylglutathione lyase
MACRRRHPRVIRAGGGSYTVMGMQSSSRRPGLVRAGADRMIVRFPGRHGASFLNHGSRRCEMSASRFVWYELMTSDPAAAGRFYESVVGWTSKDAGMGGEMPYTLLLAGAAQVGGVMGFPPEIAGSGMPPQWSGYIAVEDVDAMAARVLGAGGKVLRPAGDIPGVGRFAVMADPQGASFILFKGQGEPPAPLAAGTPGTVGWHELSTLTMPKAFEFYAALFGWTKGEAMDMGPMGTYQLFEIDGVPCGGMMNKPEQQPAPAWLYYFNVPEIHAAVDRIKAGGGQVVHGPAQVPGGSWIVNAVDPQGGMFAVVAPGTPA